MSDTKQKTPTIDELVEIGRPGTGPGDGLSAHKEAVRRARLVVARLKTNLDAWLSALENPLDEDAIEKAAGIDLDFNSESSPITNELFSEMSDLLFAVREGRAILTWEGATPPACPGRDTGCGNPLAVGERRCPDCRGRKRRWKPLRFER